MKQTLFLNFLFIFFLSNCSQKQIKNQYEHVTYPKATLPSLTELISFIEVIPLQHGDTIMVDDRIRLLQQDSSFYLVDVLGEQNIYRFAYDGRFLNKIGQKGRGPEEFPFLLDIAIEEKNDNIYVLSPPDCTITHYSKDGTFERKEQINLPAKGFCKTENGYWIFTGYPDRTLLLRLDDSLHVTDSIRLPQYFTDRMANPLPKFSTFGKNSYFWRLPFPSIHTLTTDSVEQTIFFDFKDQYIPEKDISEKESLQDKNITSISRYWATDSNILVEIGIIEYQKKAVRNIYGLKNKGLGQWYWAEYTTTPEKPFIPDWYPGRTQGFAQDGRLMCFFFGNEIEELTDEARKLITNPQELENIDPEMDMFVLLCHFK